MMSHYYDCVIIFQPEPNHNKSHKTKPDLVTPYN